MQNIFNAPSINKVLSIFALSAMLVANVAVLPVAHADESVTVTIVKYIGDERATSETANDASFEMVSTWDASNIGAGSGEYELDASDYEAVTAEMTSPADYTTSEVLNETVGANCDADEPFALVGYSYGETLEEAESASVSDEPPAFVDIDTSKYVIVWNEDCNAPEPVTDVTVHINKFVDGEQATAENADNAEFTMQATWNSESHGAGAGEEYPLNAASNYETQTVDFNPGADYSTSEIADGEVVGATCDAEALYTLAGYTTGSTFEEAEEGTPSMTPPAFTDLQEDKYVIVWNESCEDEVDPQEDVFVQINKFVDGEQADATSASSSSFTMNAAWDSENLGAGAGQYALDANGYESDATTTPYQAQTAHMTAGADYTTSEVLDGTVVGANCDADALFALEGYTTGSTFEEAAEGTPSMTVPAFTDLQNDRFVIVWNESCDDSGTIGGEVGDAELEVTSVDTIDGTATADGTFESGWEYVFHITAPSDEPKLAMKFSDWANASSSFPVANNMRISSAQADNGGATILVTAENTYTTPDLNMVTDLNPSLPGRQVQITVEVAVPVGTDDGAYTTTYGVRSNP
jgi:hypothetical protein